MTSSLATGRISGDTLRKHIIMNIHRFTLGLSCIIRPTASRRALCFFAQSLPLSILLGRAQPLCYVDSPLITFKWPSGPHTHTHTHTARWLCGDRRLSYKRHFCFLFLGEQHSSLRDLFMCWVGGLAPFLGFSLNVAETWKESQPTINVLYCACTNPLILFTNNRNKICMFNSTLK